MKTDNIKTHSKTLILGDLHIGDINFDLTDHFVELVNSDDYDAIIIGGDTFDPWRGGPIGQLILKHKAILESLEDKNVIFIKGNHDRNLDELEKSGFIVKSFYEYLTPSKRSVKILHGHEFDKYRKPFEKPGRVIIYFEEKINRLLKWLKLPIAFRITKLWFSLDRHTVWLSLRRNTHLYSNTDVLVFGHTHIPMRGQLKDSTLFYNWGSWQRDRGYRPSYVIQKGDTFSIQFLDVYRSILIFKFIMMIKKIKHTYENGKDIILLNSRRNKKLSQK